MNLNSRRLTIREIVGIDNRKPVKSLHTKTGTINSEKSAYLCNLIAQFFSNEEIAERYRQDFNKPISVPTVAYYRKTRKEDIMKLRDRYLATIAEVPIAHDKVRLERLEKHYQEAKEISDPLKRSIAVAKILSEARFETKGMGNIMNVQFNQFNQLTDEELMNKKMELEKKIGKILEMSKKEQEGELVCVTQ